MLSAGSQKVLEENAYVLSIVYGRSLIKPTFPNNQPRTPGTSPIRPVQTRAQAFVNCTKGVSANFNTHQEVSLILHTYVFKPELK